MAKLKPEQIEKFYAARDYAPQWTQAGKLTEGDNLVFVAFGGGLAWAAGVVRWGRTRRTMRKPIATTMLIALLASFD